MKKIKLSSLNVLFDEISSKIPLYIPVDSDSGAYFDRYTEGKQLSSALNTVRSPKNFFFPQTEDICSFRREGKKVEVIMPEDENEPFLLFGVRACDVRSFDILDRVFLSEPVDAYYKARREKGIVVSIACSNPKETCFCGTFGIDAAGRSGDISAWYVDDELHIDANTDKGRELLGSIGCLEDCSDERAKEAEEKIRARLARLPLSSVTTEGFGAGKTKDLFDRPEWSELADTCLGCGTCTFHCPTCQCYDIREFDCGGEIQRFRCWDSCMYSDFTKMAHGNSRNAGMQRFRQRFMHKLVYYPDNNDGIYSCVGCGRCIGRCPSKLGMVKVIKKLGGAENE